MINHLGTVQLETERLILRRFTAEDALSVYRNWASDSRVVKYLTWPVHASVQETRQILDTWIDRYDQLNFYQWSIVLKENNEPIGTISAVDIDEQSECVKIGYCIGSAWWHLGYTSEALSAIIAFFFKQVHAQRIEARHDPNNPNSGKVMRKCGLIYEGTLRKAARNNQGIVDVCVYGLLACEYDK